ncbi:TetR/AcrR family transcriptional regulator [Nicoliella lavandulae]|uniref:TetR family transcriptional regulator n=1 Tax=Nicoliella lavandulae TaxID=3082954 RepID=A0ABU8SLT9_9LACO
MSDMRFKRTDLFIFQALNNLLEQRPFSEVTVNEIATTSMVHRNTFYHHFEDKYELLHQFIIFALNKVSVDIDISKFNVEPFHVIHKLYMTSYHNLFNLQRNDDEFMKVFSTTFVEVFVKDMNDTDNIWAMGGISSIMTWNRLNGSPYDMFDDYVELDRIFKTHQFPKLN